MPKVCEFTWLKDPATVTAGLKDFEQQLCSWIAKGDTELARRYLERFFLLQVENGMDELWSQIPAAVLTTTIVHLADLGELLFNKEVMPSHRWHNTLDYIYYLNAIALQMDQRLAGEGDPTYDLHSFSATAALAVREYLADRTPNLTNGTAREDFNLYSYIALRLTIH